MANMLGQSKLSWYPGFYGAAELEFIDDKGMLEFQREYNLGKEPLRIDLLIIKKLTDARIENEIGRIFRKYNIVEYKSPEDGLSIDDYYKVMAYACLYKGLGATVGQIPASELTISFIWERYPRELFAQLKREGCTVVQKFSGIFYIKGKVPFDVQVVVTGRLESGKHLVLKMLSRHVSEADARAFMEKAGTYTDQGDRNNAQAVLQISVPANQAVYDGIRRAWNMNDFVREWLKEDIDRLMKEEVAKRIDAEVEKQVEKRLNEDVYRRLNEEVGKRLNEEVDKRLNEEVRKRLNEEVGKRLNEEMDKRLDEEVGKRLDERLLAALRNLMQNTKWTAEQAMAAISIPPSERARYAAKL